MNENNTQNDGSNDREYEQVETAALSQEQQELIFGKASELPDMVNYGGEEDNVTPSNVLFNWFGEANDHRQESYVSMEQAVAMGVLPVIGEYYANLDTDDYVLDNLDPIIDNLLTLNVSIGGIGREQQVDVLKPNVRKPRHDEEADNNSRLYTWG